VQLSEKKKKKEEDFSKKYPTNNSCNTLKRKFASKNENYFWFFSFHKSFQFLKPKLTKNI